MGCKPVGRMARRDWHGLGRLAKFYRMPKCVECGAEQPRDEMFGTSDDLRCAACAKRGRGKYVAPRLRFAQEAYPVTITIVVLAIVASLGRRFFPAIDHYLIADPLSLYHGQLWRLLTSVFPHSTDLIALHLIFNAYWVVSFGRAVESGIGSWRFAGLVGLLAVGATAAQVWAGATAIGLSGVVYGLFGMLFALRRDKSYAAEQIQPHVVQLMIVWFFLCFLLPYVANTAHGAGLGLGWLVGQAVRLRRRSLLAAAISLTCVLAMGTLFLRPDPWPYVQARYPELFEGRPATPVPPQWRTLEPPE